ncbi:unnamed protein product [Sympodiomycopsis kandeliae]
MGWLPSALARQADQDDQKSNSSSVPGFLKPAGHRTSKVKQFLAQELNFYRIHVLVFVFTPLIAAAIFYASNTDNHIEFIDCLFVCVSAMTVTGLVTINISTSTHWQQAILFFLILIGNLSAVSVTMVWVRRHFFRKKFDAVIRSNAEARKRAHDVEEAQHLERRKNLIRLRKRLGLNAKRKHHHHDDDSDDDDHEEGPESKSHAHHHSHSPHNGDGITSPRRSSTDSDETDRIAEAEIRQEKAERMAKKKKAKRGPLRADMIKRIDQPAVLINPMGMPSEGHPAPAGTPPVNDQEDVPPFSSVANTSGGGGILNDISQDNADSNQPSIRIELPPGHSQRPSLPSAFVSDDAAPLTESPANMSWSEGGDPLTSRQDHSAPLTEEPEQAQHPLHAHSATADSVLGPLPASQLRTRFEATNADLTSANRRRRTSDPTGADRTHSRRGSETGINTRFGPTGQSAQLAPPRPAANQDRMPRSQTIQYAEPPKIDPQDRIGAAFSQPSDRGYTTGVFPKIPTGQFGQARQRTFDRTSTQYSAGYRGLPLSKTVTSSKERGFGGFPTPLEIAGKGIKKAFPRVQERFVRSTTMQRSATIASTHSFPRTQTEGQRSAPYLTFDANVYGNSVFHSLTEAQRDELGGVEYRALDFLAKMVPTYWVSIQLFMVVLVAPYCASPAFDKYRPVFESQGNSAPNTTWFWFFQVASAYSNTGMSLIDSSMSMLADAYMLLIPMAFLILVGNTGFPIFLRFWIWTYSKFLPQNSRSYETVRFILDHPRRCFVYLFPSGQTWLLFAILVFMNCFDWVAFQILDIGNPVIEDIPVPQRIFDGLFQSIAVRAAGFQVVSLLTLAPAVQFLYIIMMYISAYPLALSVRSTNVYEERSLGVYQEKKQDSDDASALESSPAGWGTYLAAHARRQLAFDIWWLGFALWLVCIIERAAITDPSTDNYFTVFNCLFELTSAYGTVGLSTGTPSDAFSLSGRFKTLSKLVVIATMIRGRHRGLPVAIDRSIMLPSDLEHQDAATEAWSVIDADARSAAMSGDGYREGTSFDGTRATSGVSSFTRVATNAGLEQGGSRRSVDRDNYVAHGTQPLYRDHTGRDGAQLSPTSSKGSIAKSVDSSRQMRPAGLTPPGSPRSFHHHHQPSLSPAAAFHLSSIQERREGIATPQEKLPNSESHQLGHEMELQTSPEESSASSSEKGKAKASDTDEAQLARLYGSSDAHLVDSHDSKL